MGKSERASIAITAHYDAELRRHNERLRQATGIVRGDRVLDVGCGAGQSTRDAARAATAGSVLGVDISAELLERARRRTAKEGLQNVAYELGDAQVHLFRQGYFDVVISRFGTMFFNDPFAAFANIARASRPGARLVMMVWQDYGRNEWATAIGEALVPGRRALDGPPGANPFSLADPSVLRSILQKAGFGDIGFDEVREPVYYGANVGMAYGIVRSMRCVGDVIAALDTGSTEPTLARLRSALATHVTDEGVLFDSRAWIVTAHRGGA